MCETVTLENMFEEMIRKFKEKFKVELKFTGFENREDDLFEREYTVHGLLESDVLSVEVGGWFTIYEDGNGSCLLSIKIEGEVFPNKCLRAWYENGEWSDFEMEEI